MLVLNEHSLTHLQDVQALHHLTIIYSEEIPDCFTLCFSAQPQWETEQLRSLEERGRLLLCLQYLPPATDGDVQGESKERARGGLCVGVKRCAHLAAMDVNGYSDPYVKT